MQDDAEVAVLDALHGAVLDLAQVLLNLSQPLDFGGHVLAHVEAEERVAGGEQRERQLGGEVVETTRTQRLVRLRELAVLGMPGAGHERGDGQVGCVACAL